MSQTTALHTVCTGVARRWLLLKHMTHEYFEDESSTLLKRWIPNHLISYGNSLKYINSAAFPYAVKMEMYIFNMGEE